MGTLMHIDLFFLIPIAVIAIIVAIIMCIVVYALHFIHIDRGLMLCIQILAGAVIYASLSVLFKLEPYIYLKNLLKEKLLKKNTPTD